MAHPRDIEPGSAELLLVDLLYGELDGDEAAAAEEKVAADPELSADAEAFGELRALMRQLPDEEPPPAVSARLLHAAAASAPAADAATAAAGGGLWAWLSRIFRPLALNPALAAAATFVLVAGVAGTLYMTGAVRRPARHAPEVTPVERGEAAAHRSRPAPPAGTTSTAAPETEQAPPAVDGLSDQLDLKAGAGGAAPTDLPATRGPARAATKSSRANKLEEKRDPSMQAGPSSTPTPKAKPRPVTKKGGVFADQPPPPAPPDTTVTKDKWAEPPPEKERRAPAKPTSTTGKVTVPIISSDDVDEEAPPQEAAAPEPSAGDFAGEAEKKPSTGDEVRRLHALAQRAARDGECEAVIDLGQRIRKLDSRYYDTVFLRDKSLAPCRSGSKSQQKKGK